ncbi:MAG: hypothetical protein H6826_02915 [Planctomycetes bacterium]|nr:hypothetical protein [Planctomycetota bacterium]MCB9900280.1 hypothetical protein [Planctomycetota bacterium]
MRSGRSLDDRLLYATDAAFIELLVPRGRMDPGESDFIVGQVVPRHRQQEGSLGDFRLRIEADDGREHVVWADERGEFVIPVHGGASFKVHCETPEGPPAVVVFEGAERE